MPSMERNLKVRAGVGYFLVRVGVGFFVVVGGAALAIPPKNVLDRLPQPTEEPVAVEPLSQGGSQMMLGTSGGFDVLNMVVRSHVTPQSFSTNTTCTANSTNVCANDVWGYVSPSGREYAILGLRTGTGVVDVTDPDAPVIVGAISDASSIWSDMKTYQQYMYNSNESGGGIQVINMANVDPPTRQLSLVRSITQSGLQEAHTLALNEESGYLYLCGSNLGGGRLVALSLADPSFPVISGQALQGVYVHAAQVVSYTSGPYAGREIAFCYCGSQGLKILDVTDKSNMFTMGSLIYPNTSYCHQGWLSADKKTLYVNDEMDETGSGYTTRTLVFDVTDFATAAYVTSFTTGLNAIDHNLYVRDGFIFEANYRSGLRIFDSNDSALAPVQVGFFDTYPENNATGYDGAWSNFPFFPSGTVIVSDINRGLFILDPSAALTRNIIPGAFAVGPGLWVSGGLAEMASSDDQYFVMRRNLAQDEVGEEIELKLDGVAPSETPNAFSFLFESRAPYIGIQQRVWLWDWVASQYVLSDTRTLPTTDTAITVTPTGNLSRFVQVGTKAVRAKITLSNVQADTVVEYVIRVDRAVWRIVP